MSSVSLVYYVEDNDVRTSYLDMACRCQHQKLPFMVNHYKESLFIPSEVDVETKFILYAKICESLILCKIFG